MKSNVAFHPLVEGDATEAAEWYERRRSSLGAAFVSEYRRQLHQLPGNALLYAVRFHDIRRVNLPSFPYGIFYFLSGDEVVVLGVLHGARDAEAELRQRRGKFV